VALGPVRFGTRPCVGRDSGDAVSQEYKTAGTLKGATIFGVTVDVSPEVYIDLETEAIRKPLTFYIRDTFLFLDCVSAGSLSRPAPGVVGTSLEL
jgi:hypothetical protein